MASAASTSNLTGRVFGRLTVVRFHDLVGKRRRPSWTCECSCGNEKAVSADNLLNGHTKSCGCLSREICSDLGKIPHLVHGKSSSPEYRAWSNMKSRCSNPRAPGYAYDGGLGFVVCDEWLSDFAAFFSSVGTRPSTRHVLSRVDRSLGYEPGNVSWRLPEADLARKVARENKWKQENRSRHLASMREWYAKNCEYAKEKVRQYRLSRPDWSRAQRRKWAALNKDAIRTKCRNRRAKLAGSLGSHTNEDIKRILRLQRFRCAYCKTDLMKLMKRDRHVDHVTPISRGGSNLPRNLQITCSACNTKKGAKPPMDFARSIGLLI